MSFECLKREQPTLQKNPYESKQKKVDEAADCKPQLLETNWGMKGCGNTPVALCCLPTMSVLARSTWRISAPAQPEALGDSITVVG